MDPAARRRTWSLVEGLRDDGAAILLTTHALDEAEKLADRVVVMDGGRILAAGTVAELSGAGSLEDAFFALLDAADAP